MSPPHMELSPAAATEALALTTTLDAWAQAKTGTTPTVVILIDPAQPSNRKRVRATIPVVEGLPNAVVILSSEPVPEPRLGPSGRPYTFDSCRPGGPFRATVEVAGRRFASDDDFCRDGHTLATMALDIAWDRALAHLRALATALSTKFTEAA